MPELCEELCLHTEEQYSSSGKACKGFLKEQKISPLVTVSGSSRGGLKLPVIVGTQAGLADATQLVFSLSFAALQQPRSTIDQDCMLFRWPPHCLSSFSITSSLGISYLNKKKMLRSFALIELSDLRITLRTDRKHGTESVQGVSTERRKALVLVRNQWKKNKNKYSAKIDWRKFL